MTTLVQAKRQPVVLLVSHDASRTGAPLYFGELLYSLDATHQPFRPLVLVTGYGPLLAKWQSTKLEIVIKEKRRAGSLALKAITRMAYLIMYVRLLAKSRPRVVYSNTIRNPLEVVLGRLAGARTLVHVHEGEQMIRRHALSLRISSWFTTRYVCVSKYSAEAVKKLVKREAAVIFNGILTGADVIENEPRSPISEWVVGMAGGIQPNKGHHIAIEALAKLLKGDSAVPVRLRIYGETENASYRQSLDELIKRLGVDRNAEFCGSVAKPSDIYENVDIVVVASFDESFSRVLLESFKYGRPVIASAVGGVLEIVRHEENGLLVQAGDAEGLATALRRLMTDPALTRRLVQTAAVDVRKRFGLADTLARVRDEIRALLPQNEA